MTVDHNIQKLEKSAVKLTLTITKDDALKSYHALLGRYMKNASLPGFRRGKIPQAVLEKKFGEGLRAEALQQLIDEALHETFEVIEEKPLPYSKPQLIDKNIKLDFGQDITFSLQYDVSPQFILGEYKGLEIEEPQVVLTQEDEERELERIREQNAMMIDKESGLVAKDDVVTISFVEVVDGVEVASTRCKDFVFTVGSGKNYYQLDEELLGMQKGQERLIEKTYPAEFEPNELAGTTRSIKVILTAVKEKKLPELNDDLAQDVSEEYKTLDDLKKALREKLERQKEVSLRNCNVASILEQLAAEAIIDLPQSMIDVELEQTWQSLAMKSRLTTQQLESMVGNEVKTKMKDEWKPLAEASLRHRLIMEKVIELEKMSVSEEELKVELLKNSTEKTQEEFAKIRAYFESNGSLRYIEQQLLEKQLTDFLLSHTKIKKGQKMAYVDLIERKAVS